jgi:hypothetical protein
MHGLPNTKPSGLNNSTLLNGTVAPSIPINPWASIKGKEWQAMIQKSFAKEEFHEKMAKIMNGQIKNKGGIPNSVINLQQEAKSFPPFLEKEITHHHTKCVYN